MPTYIVSRHASNWGFLLESCWTVYTSWEMPPRDGPDCDRSLLDDELTVTMDDQWEEVRLFCCDDVEECTVVYIYFVYSFLT